MARIHYLFTLFVTFSLLTCSLVAAFQSDELLVDDEEFGLEGAPPRSPDPSRTVTRSSPSPATTTTTSRRKYSDPDPDSKIQFTLEHAFGGDADFSSAGTFSARLRTWSHGGQTLTKLRFSRDLFTVGERKKFAELVEADEFYKIRLPSNVLNPPGRDYVVSSVRARCLAKESLDEHFVIHMDGVNVLAVNYGSPGACPYPRQKKLPGKWSFNSHTVLKNSEQAPRTPVFTEDILGGGGDVEGEVLPPPERSFWAKYWMYLIPLGLIVMNAVTQAMNMPEEQAGGQSGGQAAGAVQRGGAPAAVRRR